MAAERDGQPGAGCGRNLRRIGRNLGAAETLGLIAFPRVPSAPVVITLRSAGGPRIWEMPSPRPPVGGLRRPSYVADKAVLLRAEHLPDDGYLAAGGAAGALPVPVPSTWRAEQPRRRTTLHSLIVCASGADQRVNRRTCAGATGRLMDDVASRLITGTGRKLRPAFGRPGSDQGLAGSARAGRRRASCARELRPSFRNTLPRW